MFSRMTQMKFWSVFDLQITITCPVYPTEDIERVKQALNTFFPNDMANILNETGFITLSLVSNDESFLITLRDHIHSLRVIDTARAKLLSNWDGQETVIHLDKQSAFIGRLKIIDFPSISPPLGSIEVSIAFENLFQFDSFIEWITPPTKNGAPIGT